MSVEEMKMEVIKSVIQLKSEDAVKEIAEHLNRLNNETINLSNQYQAVKNQYADVLQKLAQ